MAESVDVSKQPFRKKRWVHIAGMALFSIGAVYGMIYVDLVLRARHAYLEGEKYLEWHFHPDRKAQYYKTWQVQRLAELEKKLSQRKITQDIFQREKELLEFQKTQALEDSSIKYAYVWYQTAVELFSPPESKWVKLSREKMVMAKELWRQELRAKKIPFEEYMLE